MMIEGFTNGVSRIVLQIEIVLAENDDSIGVIVRKPGSGPTRKLAYGKTVTFRGFVVAQAAV